MTPERQRWWDSLPKEEKRVRQIYRYTKKEILNFTDHDKKYVIKALRKQIGLCPIDRASRNDPTGSCPTCNDLVIRREHDCCAGCGQKLRWQ